MNIKNIVAIVTGGASGLGEATARRIVSHGGKVVIADLNDERANKLINELGNTNALYVKTDVSNEADVEQLIKLGSEKFGKLNAAINCAGIAPGIRIVGRKGVHPLDAFTKTIMINLVGTFNVIRLFSEYVVNTIEADENAERGVIINTASVAAFDGQIGQAAYSASKGGVVGMTLPIARDLADKGIRVMTIAPGLFQTPMADGLDEAAVASITANTVNPKRLGKPDEYAQLAQHIIENQMLNGEVIRLDGATRLAPR